MNSFVRYAFIAASLIALGMAACFFLQLPWATSAWPWPTGRLSNIFIASILAAVGVPVLWIGLSGEWAAVTGGAINLSLMYAGMAVFSFQVYAQDATRRSILLFAIFCTALAVACIALIVWARRIPFRDPRPLPRGAQVSFILFATVLVLTGGALVLKRPNIFPWPLSPEQSVLYGWIFLGAACYFVYALINPKWKNAQGQLLGFLAYDVVLIVPFVNHFAKVDPGLRMSLIIYTGVIIFSGLLAIYYLLLNRATRVWMLRHKVDATSLR